MALVSYSVSCFVGYNKNHVRCSSTSIWEERFLLRWDHKRETVFTSDPVILSYGPISEGTFPPLHMMETDAAFTTLCFEKTQDNEQCPE
jgi:hypothetical protein